MSHGATTEGAASAREDTSMMMPSPASATELQIHTAPADVPSHTFSENRLDPHLYRQFILTRQTLWDTGMTAGHIIWCVEVHPSSCNAFVNYICKMYNAWGGSLEWQAMLAGTGFNGGKVMFGKTPPNIDPRTLSLTDLTVLPNTTIDVKAQESFGIVASDQRPVEYHYMNQTVTKDSEAYQSITAHGGYIYLAVLNPLIGANSGANSVSLSIFSRLAPDFTVSQMIPPSTNKTIVVDFQDLFRGSQGFAGYYHMDKNPMVMRLTDQSTVTNMSTSNVVRLRDQEWLVTDGDSSHEGNLINLYDLYGAEFSVHSVEEKIYSLPVGFLGVNACYKVTKSALGIGGTTRSFSHVQFTPKATYFKVPDLTTDAPKTCTLVTCDFGQDSGGEDCIFATDLTPIAMKTLIAPRDESFIRFTDAQAPAGTGLGQPAEVMYKLMEDAYSKIPIGQNPIFTVHNAGTDQPLQFVRLTDDGLFTAAKPKIPITDFPLSSIYLTYYMTIDVADKIPETTKEMYQNTAIFHLQRRLELL